MGQRPPIQNTTTTNWAVTRVANIRPLWMELLARCHPRHAGMLVLGEPGLVFRGGIHGVRFCRPINQPESHYWTQGRMANRPVWRSIRPEGLPNTDHRGAMGRPVTAWCVVVITGGELGHHQYSSPLSIILPLTTTFLVSAHFIISLVITFHSYFRRICHSSLNACRFLSLNTITFLIFPHLLIALCLLLLTPLA